MWDMSDFGFCAKNKVFLGYSTDTFSIKTGLTLGGFWGSEIADVLIRLFSLPGAYIISIGLLLSAVVILSPRSMKESCS